jgi:drug/metabolite transporter (DMT)-like permease
MRLASSVKVSTRTSAVVLMILSATCWGLGTVMSKGVLTQLQPLTLLVVQLTISVVFLWTLALSSIQEKSMLLGQLSPQTVLKLGFPGLIEPALSYLLGLMGLAMTTASSSTLISATEPIMVIAIAWLFLRERIQLPLLVLSGVGIVGVLLAVGIDLQEGGRSLIGDGLMVLSIFCAAVYGVLSSMSVQKIRPTLLAAIQQTTGLVAILLVWVWVEQFNFNLLTQVDNNVWKRAIASGIVQYSLPFLLYLQAIRSIPISIAVQFFSLIPVFGVCGAYVFLGERLTLLQGFGITLVVGAVAGITRLRHQPESDQCNTALNSTKKENLP